MEEEKTFLIVKYKCPYCGIIAISRKIVSQCSTCHRKFQKRKPIVIREAFV